MNKEFYKALDLLEQEKGIPKEYMIEKIEAAMIAALKKEYDKPNIRVRVHLNPDKEDVQFFRQRDVVEEVVNEDYEISLEEAKRKNRRYKVGDVFENEIKAKDLKRISAVAARQVIVHNIREAERKIVQQSYEKRREEIVSATVEKIDRETGDALIDIGGHNAILSKKEQIPGETLTIGQNIRVYIQEVDRRYNGVTVTISRRHTGFLRRLFELEVPEISSGEVAIMSIARDSGSRSKVAVLSRVEGIDAVGACIGQGKSRINNIVEECAGEKVDIIPYNEDKSLYVKAALAPANVDQVIMLDTASTKAFVAPEQLSLAIGKGGQNARLAAKLTGCKIDITGDPYVESEWTATETEAPVDAASTEETAEA